MKLNAKLLVVAMIFAMIFSISAVAATSENVTELSSDLTQVPHEQVVSVAEPTVQEVETIDLETSASDSNQEITSISSDKHDIDDCKSSSDDKSSLDEIKANEKNKKDDVLGVSQEDAYSASNDESILGATLYINDYLSAGANKFSNLTDVISRYAQSGDIIDLQGRTFIGQYLRFSKNIVLANGKLDAILGNGNYRLEGCTLENLSISNLHTGGGTGIFSCTINNVVFDNCTSEDSCVFLIRSSTLENVNFTNCHALKPADPAEQDFETGVMIVTYYSNYNNCNFINCSSNRHSGAICVAGEMGNAVNITNCNFDNCTSGVGGAIYLHGTGLSETLHSNVINCTFTNCHATEWGGAIGSSQDFLNVENCEFINNTAKQGAAFMVGGITHGLDGDNSEGNHNTMKNCHFHNNTGSVEGGAVHITGDYNTAIDCTFDDNYAINGKGAAIYVEGDHASIINTAFRNHESEMGTVYIEGHYFNCTDSSFTSNVASHGGAGLYVQGNHTFVSNSKFRDNNASMHGGAIHTIGDYARIFHSDFKENNAIPNSEDPEYGLGGAIYINGDNNEISYSTFSHNTARNGSAVYNRGEDLHLNDDTFTNNQAWSYFLFTEAKPPEAYWSEDLEFLINVTLVAGDNLINAIYNDWHKPTPSGVVDEIFFHNVTYTLKPNDLYPTGIKTTTDQEVHPILGVENSHNGAYLYQDAREDDQVVNINITYGDGEVFEYSGKTDIRGNILIAVTKENLTDGEFHPGVYNVTAHHPDDSQYTAIDNSTTFTVLPHVDVSVKKTSNKDVYFVGENAIFTITVNGVGTNATNVTVKDILPSSLRYVSARATKGSYDSTSNEWYIGFLPHGASETLTLTVQTTQLGTYDNVVNVTCTERDWNLSNNVDNKTIKVNLYYTKDANVTQTSAGEYIEYYIRIYNTGDTDYTEVFRVHDMMPSGIRYAGEYQLEGADLVYELLYPDQQIWDLTNIVAGTHAKITVKALALVDGIWNNTIRVNDYPSVNYTVNVSSSADLHIIKDVIPNIVNKGDIVNWTIIVINHGPSIAYNVYVDDVLPAGLEIAGHATPSDNTRFDRTTGRWTIGTLGVEDYVTLIIPTRVTITAHNITNTAVVNSTTPDPDPTNNEDNATIYFNPDVSIVKTVSTQHTYHGDIVSWTITVTNNGPNTATRVYVIDRITSEGLRYVNHTISKGTGYNPVSGRWTVGNLEDGESATLTINTLVTMYDGFILNNATVYASNDNDPDNNYAENFTQVITKADVGIVKLVSNQTAHYGDEIAWTIIVTNYGPNTAENVEVIDFLPVADLVQTREPYRTKGTISHAGTNGRWVIGSLANGENATLIIYTKVLSTDKTIINVVNVTTSTHDPDLSNNEAENGTYVPPECDVQVVKTVSNSTPNKGDTVVWTISVINVGPNAADNVVLHDLLPAGLEYVTHERPTTGSYSHISGNWTIGRLAVDSRQILTITTRVIDTGNITNEANATTATYDTNLANNYDNETIHVPAVADLEIIKLVSNKNPKFGELINWTIIVHNNGPNNARNVYVIDKLPAGLIYVNDSTDGEDYNPISGRWTIGDLMHYDTIQLIITTRVNITNATINNIAVVYSSTPDENETNNKANNTTHVDPVADLAIGKFVSNMHPGFNEIFNYTILVTNLGPDTAVNAYVIDHLPNGLIYISDDSNGKYDPITGRWDIGNLSAEEGLNSVSLEIVVRVNVTQPDVITNYANVTSETYDPDLTNNEDNVTIDVGHIADLKVIKIVSANTSKMGDEITWTIRVYNLGPNTAIGAYVLDSLPEELIYISHTVSKGTYYSEIGYWDIGDFEYVNNDTYEYLTILTRVNVTNMNITNIAVVNSTTPDNNESNNIANNTTVVDSFADLEIIKLVSNKTPHFGDEITWTIIVINHGPNTAYNVNVTDKLPAGLIYRGDNSGGKYDPTTGVWNIGELAKGANSTIIITTKVNITNATIINVAVVNSTTPDNNESNNIANNTTVVDPEADLEIIKLVSNATSKNGDIISWTIIVTNKGPDIAKRVFVRDEFPKELILTGFTKTKGIFDTESMVWFIEEMAKNETQTLTITARVNITNGNITNIVNVTNDVYDPNETNNEANNTTVVDPKANLVVVKLVSNSTSKFGDVIAWTIVVTNKGPDTAVNVVVTDKLPAGLVYQGDDSQGKYDSTTGVWKVGDLANGASATLVITTLVNTTNATILNVANATTDTPGNSTPGNNTTNVEPLADLEIIKLVSNSTAKKGDTIVWTIIVTNNGPDTAKDVIVKDKLPSSLEYRGHTLDKGLYDASQGIWSIGDMAKGDSIKLIITTIVKISNGTITNIAVVNSTTSDNNTDNNKANNTTVVGENADLVIIKVVSNKNPHKGDTITWTITVINKGPDTAVNVVVTDKLPAGLIFNGADGDYDPATGVWNVGNLAKDESRSLVITTIVNITNTTIRNVANVTTGTYDPNKTNDEANNTTVVSPEADLEIVKLVSAKNTYKGDIITWTIVVTNKGPDTALNIYVVDELPAGLVYKSHSNAKGLFDHNKLTWYIPSLNKGDSATLTIDTLVNVSDTTLINKVNVTNDVYDPNETNNKANNTTVVGKEDPVDLEVSKVVSNKNPHKGDTITWTITVTNHGPGVAIDVKVTDKLPDGLQFVSSNGNYNKDTGVWTIGNMNNGETKTLVITTKVAITNANITNIAVVNSTTPDNNTDNNEDNDTTNVDPEADLKIIKTVSNPKPSKGDVITWTIVVVNLGPDAAKDVLVSEELPDGLRLISAKGSKGNYENGIWTIGTLNNGQMATLTITTEVLISDATIENLVVVNSSTYDPDESNNNDTESVDVTDPEDDGGDDGSDDGNEGDGDEDEGEGTSDSDGPSGKTVKNSPPRTMHATGNPVVVVLLALLAVAGVSLRRRE